MNCKDLYPAFFAALDRDGDARLHLCDQTEGVLHARCPAHQGKHRALSAWIGRDGRLMFGCWAGCPKLAILAALGLSWSDCFPPKDPKSRRVRAVKPERTHEYLGAGGEVLCRKCIVREADGSKRGYWQRWDRDCGLWANGLCGVACVPYRLPELIASAPRIVLLVESEKDADALAALGFVSTTGGGSSCWHEGWSALHLAARPVCLLPHNDPAGRKHSLAVGGSLLLAGCPSVRLCRWPEATPEHWDVADELEACRRSGDGDGGLRRKVMDMVRSASHWRAA